MSKAAKTERIDPRAFYIRQEQSRCRHFTGFIINQQCAAGMTYLEQNAEVCMPCVPRLAHDRRVLPCDKFSIVSLEEAEKIADQRIAEQEKSGKALFAAKEHAQSAGFGKGHGGFGQLKCPVCETGDLRYRVSASNGHMQAQCSTPTCITFME